LRHTRQQQYQRHIGLSGAEQTHICQSQGQRPEQRAHAIHIPVLEANGTVVQCDEQKPWDVTSDGIVNIFNQVAVASQFGQSGENLDGDVSGDGIVNIFGLILVAAHFGE